MSRDFAEERRVETEERLARLDREQTETKEKLQALQKIMNEHLGKEKK